MNNIEEGLIKLRTVVITLDSTTSELYEPMSNIIHNLKTMPDTITGANELKIYADEVISIVDSIQAKVNETWGGIESMFKRFEGKSQVEADVLAEQFSSELAEITTNTAMIGVSVDLLQEKSMALVPKAIKLLTCVLNNLKHDNDD